MITLAALEQLPARIAPQQQRGHDRNQDGDHERLKARHCAIGFGIDQAAIVEEEAAEQRDALPRIRQRGEHGEIPEQDLEQQRQVADQFDIAAGNARQQPVRRQPAERHEESDHGGKEDADDRDQQRVEQADEEHAGIGVGSGIRNQALADVKARRVRQKAEAGRDPLRLQIGAGVGDDLVADPGQRRDEQDLEDKSAPARAAAERAPQSGDKLRRWWSGLDGHRRGRWRCDQRIGGAY